MTGPRYFELAIKLAIELAIKLALGRCRAWCRTDFKLRQERALYTVLFLMSGYVGCLSLGRQKRTKAEMQMG